METDSDNARRSRRKKNINHKEVAFPLNNVIEITNVTETNQCHI